MFTAAFETFSSAVAFYGLCLPIGFLLVRWFEREELSPLTKTALAMGAGIPVTLFLLALELAIGGPWLILPTALGSVLFLRPGGGFLRDLRRLAPEVTAGLILATLAFLANVGDIDRTEGRVSMRIGFDVSDRAFYGSVAQELERAPIWALENPAFAPVPLQYSYLPALAGTFLRGYAGVDALMSFGVVLPAIAMLFTAMAAAALAEALGATLRTRALTILLVTLGGDLSFLVTDINQTWLERTRHFFVFYSFGSEMLFYNSWMMGLPLLLAALVAILKILEAPTDRRSAVIPAIIVAALFQTKVFAFIVIWSALGFCALVWKSRTLAAAAFLSLLLSTPGMMFVFQSGEARGGLAPVGVEPLAFVKDAIVGNPSLQRLAAAWSVPLAVLVVLAGAMGFRLLGLPLLLRLCRPNTAIGPRFLLLVTIISWTVALLAIGRPNRIDGIQFMIPGQAILAVFASLSLVSVFNRSVLFSIVASGLVVSSLVTPARYLLMKASPERFTSPGARDRARFTLSVNMAEAAEWLRLHSRRSDRLVMPLVPDAMDMGGARPTYVGLLSSRRIVASPVPLHVTGEVAAARQAKVLRLFETEDPTEGISLLDDLQASWVWETAEHPLRFGSSRLVPRAQFGNVRLLGLAPSDM